MNCISSVGRSLLSGECITQCGNENLHHLVSRARAKLQYCRTQNNLAKPTSFLFSRHNSTTTEDGKLLNSEEAGIPYSFSLSKTVSACRKPIFSSRPYSETSLGSNGAKTRGKRLFHSTSPLSAENQKDFYEVLGVAKTATQAELKKAYYQMAKQYHPDANKNNKEAEVKFKEVNAAYEVLGNEEKRKKYDQFGHAAFDPSQFSGAGQGGMSIEDLLRQHGIDPFEMMMGMGGGGGGGGPFGGGPFGGFGGFGGVDTRGADVEVPLRLTFKEAVNGVEKEVKYQSKIACTTCSGTGAKPGTKPTVCSTCGGRGQQVQTNGFMHFSTTCSACGGQGKVPSSPCATCRGRGTRAEMRTVKVTIPAGVDNGNNVRMNGMGNAGEKGGKPGNLYVRLSVADDPIFKREGTDVHVDIPISFTQAVLGATVPVQTLTGEVQVTVPAGTQPGEKRVLRSKGIRKVNSNQFGNQYIHFKVKIPSSISQKQKQLLEEFQKEEKP
eukprot:TRINITY_DN4179_c0_g1_i1.p1 TRINITY_DN4179_c0_g1~~TRINITY_DN4179_c0_g1_i1.p1  ORF type:complete len:495 (+),score=104.79 TRINITY_DN4179_c0_g1_i1:114-1598(+)